MFLLNLTQPAVRALWLFDHIILTSYVFCDNKNYSHLRLKAGAGLHD